MWLYNTSYNVIENGHHTENHLVDRMRLAVIPTKNHQLTLMRKTPKEYISNNKYYNNIDVRLYSDDIGKKFSTEKCVILIMKSGP